MGKTRKTQSNESKSQSDESESDTPTPLIDWTKIITGIITVIGSVVVAWITTSITAGATVKEELIKAKGEIERLSSELKTAKKETAEGIQGLKTNLATAKGDVATVQKETQAGIKNVQRVLAQTTQNAEALRTKIKIHSEIMDENAAVSSWLLEPANKRPPNLNDRIKHLQTKLNVIKDTKAP